MEKAAKEISVVDVRKLSKKEYQFYKAKVENEMLVLARQRREQRFIEALPKVPAPKEGERSSAEQQQVLDVRGMTKEEYK